MTASDEAIAAYNDVLAKNLVQATATMRYGVQCCGLVAQVIQSDLRDSRLRLLADDLVAPYMLRSASRAPG